MKAHTRHRRLPRNGFTLIELLTVIAIIGILAAITIVTVGNVRTAADRAHASSNLRGLFYAATTYANDNQDRVLPNRYQNPWFNNQNWRQYLVDLGYYEAAESLERNVEELGHRGFVRRHGEQAGLATFAMNVRMGYRPNPAAAHGPGTFSIAEVPTRTLFFVGGVYREGFFPDSSYNDVAWPQNQPGLFPDADDGGKVVLLFLDGHVEVWDVNDIPRDEAANTEGRLFWRGTYTRYH